MTYGVILGRLTVFVGIEKVTHEKFFLVEFGNVSKSGPFYKEYIIREPLVYLKSTFQKEVCSFCHTFASYLNTKKNT